MLRAQALDLGEYLPQQFNFLATGCDGLFSPYFAAHCRLARAIAVQLGHHTLPHHLILHRPGKSASALACWL